MVDTNTRDLAGTQRSLRQAIDRLEAPAPPSRLRGSRAVSPSMFLRFGKPWLAVMVLAVTATLLVIGLLAA